MGTELSEDRIRSRYFVIHASWLWAKRIADLCAHMTFQHAPRYYVGWGKVWVFVIMPIKNDSFSFKCSPIDNAHGQM
jgi:hypothetical protein